MKLTPRKINTFNIFNTFDPNLFFCWLSSILRCFVVIIPLNFCRLVFCFLHSPLYTSHLAFCPSPWFLPYVVCAFFCFPSSLCFIAGISYGIPIFSFHALSSLLPCFSLCLKTYGLCGILLILLFITSRAFPISRVLGIYLPVILYVYWGYICPIIY